MDEQKSFPVRYMVLHAYDDDNLVFEIHDTLCSGVWSVVAKAYNIGDADRIAKLLNESEGYVYEPKT